MQIFERPHPVFRYQLDARTWAGYRREIAALKNADYARVGVAAIDAFTEAIDSPPPTQAHLDRIFEALRLRSLVVVRDVAGSLWVLAALHPGVAPIILDRYPGLPSLGRWAVLWTMALYTQELRPTGVGLLELALRDRSKRTRSWAVENARMYRFQQFIPRVRELMEAETDTFEKSLLAQELSIMERGYAIEPDEDGRPGTLRYIAHDGTVSGYSPSLAAREYHLDFDAMGRAAVIAAADPDPARLRALMDSWSQSPPRLSTPERCGWPTPGTSGV